MATQLLGAAVWRPAMSFAAGARCCHRSWCPLLPCWPLVRDGGPAMLLLPRCMQPPLGCQPRCPAASQALPDERQACPLHLLGCPAQLAASALLPQHAF